MATPMSAARWGREGGIYFTKGVGWRYLPPSSLLRKIRLCHPNSLISSPMTFGENSHEAVLRGEGKKAP